MDWKNSEFPDATQGKKPYKKKKRLDLVYLIKISQAKNS